MGSVSEVEAVESLPMFTKMNPTITECGYRIVCPVVIHYSIVPHV